MSVGTASSNSHSEELRAIEATLNPDQAYFKVKKMTHADGAVSISIISEMDSDGLKALSAYMKVRLGGKEYAFKQTSPFVYEIEGIPLLDPKLASDFEIYLKDSEGITRTLFRGLDLEAISRPAVHELKALANTKKLPSVFIEPEKIKQAKVAGKAVGRIHLQTDLHTHLAAVPTGIELIRIATANGSRPFYYPVRLLTDERVGIKQDEIIAYQTRLSLTALKELKRLGIDGNTKGIANTEFLTGKPDDEFVDLNTLTPEHREKFLKWLSIPPTKQITFDDMEKFYEYREPFIKNVDFLEDILDVCAKNYQAAGVNTVSLSFSKRACLPEWFAILDRVLPRLESEYGVKMRFLVGMTRLLTEDAQRDTVEEFKRVAHHPYIEGVDVFGSEINSTWGFYQVLSDLAKWCEENSLSHKVIRVHAGESSYHPENVGAAMRLAKEHNIQVRIGHGLYGSGSNAELMQFYRENGLQKRVTIEMNPDSNYALNHIDSLEKFQISQLVDEGVSLVLGSDGHGLYLTDAIQQADALSRIEYASQKRGAQHDYTKISDRIRDTEKHEIRKAKQASEKDKTRYNHALYRYIMHSIENDATLSQTQIEDAKALCAQLVSGESTSSSNIHSIEAIRGEWVEKYTTYQASVYPAIHNTKERQAMASAEKARKHDVLLKALGPKVTEEKVMNKLFQIKTPVMITGGFENDQELTLEDLKKVMAAIKSLVKQSNPDKVCFVTTGTNLGLQKYVHTLLEKEKERGRVFDVVGLIANNAKPESIAPAITHAVLGYDKWFDMHGYIGSQLDNHPQFKLLAIGGNMLTRNLIQTCLNIQNRARLEGRHVGELYCMEDSPGASSEKARNIDERYRLHAVEITPTRLGIFSRLQRTPSPPSSSSSSSASPGSSIGSEDEQFDELPLIETPEIDEYITRETLYADINGPMGAIDANDQALFMARYLLIHGLTDSIELLRRDLLEFIERSEDNPESASKMPIVDAILSLDVSGDLQFLKNFKQNLRSLGFELPQALDNMLSKQRFDKLVSGAQQSKPITRMKTRGTSIGMGGSLDLAPPSAETKKRYLENVEKSGKEKTSPEKGLFSSSNARVSNIRDLFERPAAGRRRGDSTKPRRGPKKP